MNHIAPSEVIYPINTDPLFATAEFRSLNSWKISIFNIIKNVSYFTLKILISYHLNLIFFRHLKQGIQHFHEMFVLAQADKAENNAIVV